VGFDVDEDEITGSGFMECPPFRRRWRIPKGAMVALPKATAPRDEVLALQYALAVLTARGVYQELVVPATLTTTTLRRVCMNKNRGWNGMMVRSS
jgi:hypothetical protein